jgi:hypothetical protein
MTTAVPCAISSSAIMCSTRCALVEDLGFGLTYVRTLGRASSGRDFRWAHGTARVVPEQGARV